MILLSEIGLVSSNIARLVSDERCLGIRFTPRVANGVAHSLINLACLLDYDLVWMEDCSSSVCSLILAKSVVPSDSVV
ncbi:hypothetical protein ACOSQ3_018640 [Xanthoceras sorbifolium]